MTSKRTRVYIPHPAASIDFVASFIEDLQIRRPDLELISPFQIEGLEKYTGLVKRRVAGERVSFPKDYAEQVVRENVHAIATSDLVASFHTQQNTIGSEMEKIYALLFGKKAVDIFTDQKNIYRVHPWLVYFSDQVFKTPEDFEVKLDETITKTRQEDSMKANHARNWIRNYVLNVRRPVPVRGKDFIFYLAHATKNIVPISYFEECFEQNNPGIALLNPFTELEHGELDKKIIEKMNRGDFTSYPRGYAKRIVHKDVVAIAERCHGLVAVIKDYTIGGDMEPVFENLLGLLSGREINNPIAAICSTNMIDHPFIEYHMEHRFATEADFERAAPEIVENARAGVRNERREDYSQWLRSELERFGVA